MYLIILVRPCTPALWYNQPNWFFIMNLTYQPSARGDRIWRGELPAGSHCQIYSTQNHMGILSIGSLHAPGTSQYLTQCWGAGPFSVGSGSRCKSEVAFNQWCGAKIIYFRLLLRLQFFPFLAPAPAPALAPALYCHFKKGNLLVQQNK